MTPAVKICGVCSAADAALVADQGGDYIGVILAPGRSRSRTVAEAAAIYEAADGVRRVGVFVDAAPDEVRRAVERLRLDAVQLHGAELAEHAAACGAAGSAVWKAVAVRASADVAAAVAAYAGSVDALVLDGAAGGVTGGAGVGFDWQAVAPVRAHWPATLRLIAAGGLHADNVLAAIAILQPDIVDVSSGVESAPGVKSADRLRRFIMAARAGAAERLAT